MPLSFPVRRYIQSTNTTESPPKRFGEVQWVLTRALYRFQTFDLAQVPPKNRSHALRLQLSQWTPFSNTSYYVGQVGQQALVWGWDTDKVTQSIQAKGLKPQNVRVLPETVLQPPLDDGLCLARCREGFEGQLWRAEVLERSRWWPQIPAPDEWLMFQRDAGIAATEQQHQPPTPRVTPMGEKPWISETASSSDKALQIERTAVFALIWLLLIPTLWDGFSMLKVQQHTAQLREQLANLQREAAPNTVARSQALDYRDRVDQLVALGASPSQLALMARVAEVLPNDKSYLKSWDFQQGQLKVTITSPGEVSATALIGILQQAGPFREVKAQPSPDPKIVALEMLVDAE